MVARAKWNVAEPMNSSGFVEKAKRIPPTAAHARNSIARNKRPLPTKHSCKKPIFELTEAVTQHTNKPQECDSGKGTKFIASATVAELARSQEPGSCGSAGTEMTRDSGG